MTKKMLVDTIMPIYSEQVMIAHLFLDLKCVIFFWVEQKSACSGKTVGTVVIRALCFSFAQGMETPFAMCFLGYIHVLCQNVKAGFRNI